MIYMDNGATTYPKPPEVAEAMLHFIRDIGSNVNRGSYDNASDAGDVVYETRELLAELFYDDRAEQVVFTRNVTESLNLVMKGLLTPGDHALVSSMEHNAVIRPLTGLAERQVSFSRIPCSREGYLLTDQLSDCLKENTRAVVITHASNVCGSVMDLERTAAFCRQHKLDLIIDAAQTAGVLPIDVKVLTPAAVCFTGHKGLYGPQGTGGTWLSRETAARLRPLVEGGTGSFSEEETQPDRLPDKFEAGTLNMPGIFGLHAALRWLKTIGIDQIYAHEMDLTRRFLEGIQLFPSVSIVGPSGLDQRTAVVSITCPRHDLGEVAHRLSKDYGLATRSGMHCAPSAHKTLGTYPAGTIRFSFSYFNTCEEVDKALSALWKLLK